MEFNFHARVRGQRGNRMLIDDRSTADEGSTTTLVIDFNRLLSLEVNPQQQAKIRKALAEEADLLAKERQLENRLPHVRQGNARSGRVKTTKSKRSGDDRLAILMEVTIALLQNFHHRLLKEFPQSIKLQDAVVGVCISIREAKMAPCSLIDSRQSSDR